MPIKYIPYFPNTVEGQALLDNFTRTKRALRYRDNDKVVAKILRGMPYYEAEKQEQVGEGSDNLVIRGECVSACAYLKEMGIKVDLVYIDPPFASGADYAKRIFLRKNPKLAEYLKTNERELDNDSLSEFEEKLYGDIWQKENYLNWIYENLMAIKSIMSDIASIYVHLSWHIGHYVKIILDEVFGEDNFKNEIVWHYRTGNLANKQYQKKHDTIFFYTKEDDWVFIPQDVKEYYFCLYGPNFKSSFEGRQTAKDDYGEYRISQVDDVWDISGVFTLSSEHQQYATQKPAALLERIIKASSENGFIVADFFGGSGVTAKVSHGLGRKFIHVDVGINSIQTTRDLLVEAGASFNILEIKDGVNLFRNPEQTMDKLASLIPGLQRQTPGIGKFWFGTMQDSKSGTIPVYVPNLVDSSERVMDIPLVNQIINKEIQNLEINAQKAIVYYIDVDDRKAIEAFIKEHNPTTTKIELRDLKEILYAVVVDDEVKIQSNINSDGYEIIIEKYYSDRLKLKLAEFSEKRALQAISKGSSYTPFTISEEGLELIEYISLDCENIDGPWKSSVEIKINKDNLISIDGNKTKNLWDGKINSKKQPLRIKIRNISGDEIIKSIVI